MYRWISPLVLVNQWRFPSRISIYHRAQREPRTASSRMISTTNNSAKQLNAGGWKATLGRRGRAYSLLPRGRPTNIFAALLWMAYAERHALYEPRMFQLLTLCIYIYTTNVLLLASFKIRRDSIRSVMVLSTAHREWYTPYHTQTSCLYRLPSGDFTHHAWFKLGDKSVDEYNWKLWDN